MCIIHFKNKQAVAMLNLSIWSGQACAKLDVPDSDCGWSFAPNRLCLVYLFSWLEA